MVKNIITKEEEKTYSRRKLCLEALDA